MKYAYIFISLILITGFTFAQTPEVQIQVSEEITGQNTNQVLMDINIMQPLQVGFSIDLPDGIMASVSDVKIASEPIWIKKESGIPQGSNTMHWTEQDGKIILLFAPNILAGGSNIQLSMQVFRQSSDSDSRELSIKQIEVVSEGTYRTGSEIGRVQVFQSNNTETR